MYVSANHGYVYQTDICRKCAILHSYYMLMTLTFTCGGGGMVVTGDHSLTLQLKLDVFKRTSSVFVSTKLDIFHGKAGYDVY